MKYAVGRMAIGRWFGRVSFINQTRYYFKFVCQIGLFII